MKKIGRYKNRETTINHCFNDTNPFFMRTSDYLSSWNETIFLSYSGNGPARIIVGPQIPRCTRDPDWKKVRNRFTCALK